MLNVKKMAYIASTAFITSWGILGYALATKDAPEANLSVTAPCKVERIIYSFSRDKYISEVIAKSKYPFTLAAIAKVESDFRPQIKGDGGKSYGLYQYQQALWGFSGNSIEEQTKKAETILSSLIAKHGYHKAIERYNGKGKLARKYKKKVVWLVRQMEVQYYAMA